MRIIIVDDMSNRHYVILRECLKAQLVTELRSHYTAKSVSLGGDLSWAELVFLDHDMCEMTELNQHGAKLTRCPAATEGGIAACRCQTGLDVVRRMVALPNRPAVVVHSLNPVGAKQMAEELAAAGFKVALVPVTKVKAAFLAKWVAR